MSDIKAIIFDNYQVIFSPPGVDDHSDLPSERLKIAHELGITIPHLEKEIYTGEFSNQAYFGTLSTPDVWRSLYYVNRRPIPSDEELWETDERFWWNNVKPFYNAELVEYIKSLRTSYKTALLSDAWDNIFRDWKKAELSMSELFDNTCISHVVGSRKSEREMFEKVLDGLNTKPFETIFVDDNPKNIDFALSLGLLPVRFINTEQAIRDINQLLYDFNI